MSTNADRRKNQKGCLKEKVLQIYEKIFQGQDITQGRAEFWHDFFLLSPNLKWLSAHFEKTVADDLVLSKPQLYRLLVQCLHTAHCETHHIRVRNAIQTMDALVTGVHRCKLNPDSEKTASDFLLSGDQVKDFMHRYTSLCLDMFRDDRPELLRCLMLNSMHAFASASSNIYSNPFAIGLLNMQIVDCLRMILVSSQLRYPHGLAACRLLGLLIQIGRQNVDNPFSQCQCLMDDELFLNGVTSTVSLALSEYNIRFHRQSESSGGLFSSVSSFFGGLFSTDMASDVSLRPSDSLLMCMYAIAKNGTHFSTILSYSTAHHDAVNGFDAHSPSVSVKEDRRSFISDSAAMLEGTGNRSQNNGSESCFANASILDSHSMGSDNTIHKDPNRSDLVEKSACGVQSDGLLDDLPTTRKSSISQSFNASLEPRNLLADLLEYCSIVMQDVKSTESIDSGHLCLIIVLCITQNPMACSILHDPHVTFKVFIHKHRTRYHKPGLNSCSNCSGRPIAVAILSLVVEFIRGHLMKKLPHRSYSIACSICRNLLCHQVKHRIRLDFDWKQLWSALLSLLQFLLKLDPNALSLEQSFPLMLQVLQLFNLCILYGDHFLPTADFYDDLYYEIIRMRSVFDHLYEHDVNLREIVNSVILHMGNIRSIANHFAARIAAFSASNNLTSLTEDQVLNVVRDNYESLNLRVYEGLNILDEYDENADQLLFTSLLATSLKQARGNCLETQSFRDPPTIN